ncbi:hypothetical protein SAMN02983003_0112 [Devosia enhydra]|uniref:Uncharacterized protein n=1 Tax=Devosia enhydra TaxID=665118 RepID=A0A1K2HSA7_9HYPH|nr:hypothetical protein SAMN02983003_0112 [Devosia enhydra]
MYLAFDTETTDRPRYHLALTHPFRPHLVQFAGIVFDQHGYEIDRLVTLVKPGPGALMSVAAHQAHGMSIEQPTSLVLELLQPPHLRRQQPVELLLVVEVGRLANPALPQISATGTPLAPCLRMKAFCASENCDAFIVLRSFQPQQACAETLPHTGPISWARITDLL